MNCSICTLGFNKNKRTLCVCPTCDFRCCSECLLKYFQSKRSVTMKCLQITCLFEYNYLFIKSLLGTVRTNRLYKDILFDDEKVTLEKSRRLYLVQTKQKQLQNCKKVLSILSTLPRESLVSIDVITNELNSFSARTKKEVDEIQKLKSTQLCIEESCKGFLSPEENWLVCTSCRVKACDKCCSKIQDEKNHVCDENTLKNIENVLSNTKECPCCFKKIYKIEGCDQMFCTLCKTKFLWGSLKIINSKAFHNLHFLDEINNHRLNSKSILDKLDKFKERLIKNNHSQYEIFYEVQKRLSFDVITFLKDKLITKMSEYEKKKHVLRINFLEKSVSEPKYKNQILGYFTKISRHKKDCDDFEKLYRDMSEEIKNYVISGDNSFLRKMKDFLETFVKESDKLPGRTEVSFYKEIIEKYLQKNSDVIDLTMNY